MHIILVTDIEMVDFHCQIRAFLRWNTVRWRTARTV